MIVIRRVSIGDEQALAHVQTESWRMAFQKILDKDTLDKCTDIAHVTAMYRNLLEEQKANGYMLTLDDKAKCIAWWDAARDQSQVGKAEIICIHCLPESWRQGYGSMMMDHVLSDIKTAGYTEVVLWVFKENKRARLFYEARGFHEIDVEKTGWGPTEVCYQKTLLNSPVSTIRELKQ